VPYFLDNSRRIVHSSGRHPYSGFRHAAGTFDKLYGSGVAHDFNNMLGVILGHTELALKLRKVLDTVPDKTQG
jgi:hypothetical protein